MLDKRGQNPPINQSKMYNCLLMMCTCGKWVVVYVCCYYGDMWCWKAFKCD